MKKSIKILVFLSIFAFIPIIMLIAFSPYLLRGYKDELSKFLEGAFHRKVEIKKISLTLLKGLGLSVEELKIHNLPGYKNDFLLVVDSLHLSMEFWPLLQQKVESHGITIDRPLIFIETNSKGISNLEMLGEESEGVSSPSPRTSRPDVIPDIKIEKLNVISGSFSDENALSKDSISLEGLDIDFSRLDYSPGSGAISLLRGITAEGTVKISRGKINQFQFENLNGMVSLKKADLLLKNWTLNGYGGTFSGNLDLTLKEKFAQFHLDGKADKLNLQTLLNENITSKDLMDGVFYFNLAIEGAGLSVLDMERNLSGKGNFLLLNGSLKSVNLLRQISLLSKLPMLQNTYQNHDTKIDSLKGTFMVNRGKIIFQSITGTIPVGTVTGTGSIDFHKIVDFKLQVLLNKNETGKLPQEAKPYLVDKDNQASFPITLQGDISSPSVRLEGSKIRQKVIREGIKEGIRSLLDRLNPK